jgi:AcrR family transcriptional regulator
MDKDEIVKLTILNAAKRVFQKWGLNKTTMEDIAHEAGKGKSTLYYYYKSKDEIFHALIKDELDSIIIKATTSIIGVTSAKDKLKKYVVTMLNEIKDTVSIYPLAKGEIKGDKEFLDKIRKQINDKEESIIMEILKQGVESGEFAILKKTELKKAAEIIAGIVRVMSIYLFFDNDDSEKIDISVKLLTNGV